MTYNKLVRDNIPAKIEANGEIPVTHIADEQEYKTALKNKLREEIAEFLEDESTEELADVLEVLDAWIALKGYNRAQIENIQRQKHEERGGFLGRVILDGVRPAKQQIQAGIYRHYKGNLYEVQACGTHSETGEQLVVYRALYNDYDMMVRPYSMFTEEIVVNGISMPRFTLVKAYT